MKHLLWILIASISIGIIGGCSSDDGPGVKEKRLLNERDSAICAEIFTAMREALPSNFTDTIYNPADPATWIVDLRWDALNEEFRVIGLKIPCYESKYSHFVVPECIGELDSLERLVLLGPIFGPTIPESLCQLKNFNDLVLQHTSVEVLPDNIFNERTKSVQIIGNPALKELPSSITKLFSPYSPTIGSIATDFRIFDNPRLETDIPYIPYAFITLRGNGIRHTDVRNLRHAIGKVNGKYYHTGVELEGNKIHELLPEEVLADSLWAKNAYSLTLNQQQGFEGYTNLPDWAKKNPHLNGKISYLDSYYE